MRRDIPVSTSYLIWHLRRVVGASPLRKVLGEDGAGHLAHFLPHRGYGLIRNNPNNKCGYGRSASPYLAGSPSGLGGVAGEPRLPPSHPPAFCGVIAACVASNVATGLMTSAGGISVLLPLLRS